MNRLALLSAIAIGLCGCHAGGPPAFEKPMKLGGQEISADRLNRGRAVYTQYCRACHGDSGEGNGPASSGLRPPPRNFTKALFKFGGTLPRDGAPSLPTDADLVRVIRGGLHGSAMLSWDIPDPELQDLLQYLKTFGPRWKDEAPGEPLVPSVDPWGANDAKAVELGRKLYHGLAQCSSCHPAYSSKAEIAAAVKELQPSAPPPSFRDDLFASSPVDSIELSVDGAHPLRVLPPDFLHQPMKSVRENQKLSDLYRVVSLGVPGAGMPPWRDTLTEPQLWAIAHYLGALSDLRDTPGAAQLEAARAR